MARKAHPRFHQIVSGHLKAHGGDLALAVLCIVGSTVAALITPWPLKLVFDQILLDKPLPAGLEFLAAWVHGGSIGALAALAVLIVLIAFLTGFFSYWQLFITSRLGYQIVYKLRGEMFEHLQRLSLSFHNRARTGELMSKITTDTNTLKDVYSEYLVTFATHVLTVLSMFGIMLILNWKLAILVALTFPALSWALFHVLRQVRRSAKSQRTREGNLAARVSEVLTAVNLVQAFGRERYERDRFESESVLSMEESIRASRMEAAATRLVQVVSALGIALVVGYGGWQVLSGALTPGDLLVFTTYITNMYKPVRVMARLSARISRASVSVERIGEILEIEPEIRDAPDAMEARDLRGEVEFRNVSFGYEPGKPILKDVSFRVPAGRRVALVGASGAGKSTVANLILRLYDPVQGQVLIDGTDVRQYQRESLRREVGVVLQDTVLFGISVRENIAYGKPDAKEEEVQRAAREVHAHDFIERLPQGYDEVLGEGGGTLSGGQRQRICLARALIKRPSILIMDEPTSAVDADSEALIRDAVRHLQQGKTTLLIAHQLYSVQDADWILVLKDGGVVEQGTHDDLLRRGGYYCELFRLGEIKAGEQSLAAAS
jgi:ATP-binding cassette subfamily B protein/subfamily B ATP-binding cassette protein MsbA